MTEQLSLVGIDAESTVRDGLFFAIFPDEHAARRIVQLTQHLRGEHGLRSRSLPADRLHVTLHNLGEYAGLPRGVVAAAREAAAAVEMPPFRVMFDRAVSFSRGSRNGALVLCGEDGIIELAAFQRALGAAMMKVGLGRWTKPRYTPHMTLLYDDRSINEQAVGAIAWTVHEFVLVHSLRGQTRHIPLARWPLRG